MDTVLYNKKLVMSDEVLALQCVETLGNRRLARPLSV